MDENRRPLSVGYWFSLGHPSVVFVLALLLSLGIKSLAAPVREDNSELHHVTELIGTTVSGTFLYLIALINIVILAGIWQVFRQMRSGHFDEAALEQQLNNRLLARVMKSIHQAVADARPCRGEVDRRAAARRAAGRLTAGDA